MADITISGLARTTADNSALIPISQLGTTYSTPVSTLFSGTGVTNKITVGDVSVNSNASIEANYRAGNPGISTSAVGKNLYIATNNTTGSLIFETNGTTVMSINPSGQISTPLRPAFGARNTTSQSPGNGGKITFNVSTGGFNVGNHYNYTTSVFTAPYTGLYFLHATVLINTAGSYKSAYFYNTTQDITLPSYGYMDGSGYQTLNPGGVFLIQANNNIEVRASSPVSFTVDNSGYFSGYFIG